MSKLTLSVGPDVVLRAKRYAKLHGVSLSEMVEAYLAAVADPAGQTDGDAPILHSLRGSLKKAGATEHKKHLDKKHR